MILPVCLHYDPETPRGCRLDRLVPRDCPSCPAHSTDTEAEKDPSGERSTRWADEHE
jgi:hypothetical protein